MAIAIDRDSSVPGTVHLVDLEYALNAKHASGSHRDIILVPSPSDDRDDPLNWSRNRKLLSTACVCVCVEIHCIRVLWSSVDDPISYTLCIGIASAAIYSVLEPIANDTGLTLSDLNAGTGYMVRETYKSYGFMLKASSFFCSDGVACSGNLLPCNMESVQLTCYRYWQPW